MIRLVFLKKLSHTCITCLLLCLTSFIPFRLNYIFVIGKGTKPYISLAKGKGVRLTAAEERDKRLAAKQ